MTGLVTSFGSGAMTNSIDEIAGADVILIIGSNTTEAHPVLALQAKAARKRGARLITIDPRRIEMADLSDVWLQPLPGTNVPVLNAIMKVILDEGLHDREFIEARTEGFEELRASLERYTPEYAESVSGVPAEKIRQAARLYAGVEKASILYAMGITQHTHGTEAVLAVANLAMLTGNLGRESVGVNPLRGQNNVQGACDVGCLYNVLPGYAPVTDETARRRFEAAWGVGANGTGSGSPVNALPAKPGLTATEMMGAAYDGRLKALLIMGENPVLSDADSHHVVESLKKLDFLAVIDIFLTETAQLADVVLPAASFAEKTGTFTNTERRVQLVRQAIKPIGDSRPDWQILQEIGRRLGLTMNYSSPAEIMDEVATVTPIYGGISHDRLGDQGLQWPCPTRDHPGTKFLHKDKFPRGRGRFSVVHYRPSAEPTDEHFPLILTTGRILYHYHTGSMTRRSGGLRAHRNEPYVEIHPTTALRHGIADGDLVRIITRRGQVEAKARVTNRTGIKVLFMPFHYAEAAANVLTNPALDPLSKIPEFKACAVRVEKVEEAVADRAAD